LKKKLFDLIFISFKNNMTNLSENNNKPSYNYTNKKRRGVRGEPRFSPEERGVRGGTDKKL
jgi:hypothetical protein